MRNVKRLLTSFQDNNYFQLKLGLYLLQQWDNSIQYFIYIIHARTDDKNRNKHFKEKFWSLSDVNISANIAGLVRFMGYGDQN